MFERFTDEARAALVLAQETARGRSDFHIGTEHLLLGLLKQQNGVAAQVLTSVGISAARVTEVVDRALGCPRHVTPGDVEVLQELGIDATAILDEARKLMEEPGSTSDAAEPERPPTPRRRLRVRLGPKPSHGPRGHIPFTPKAKKTLENSLREALKLGDNYIGPEHLLLGLLRTEGMALEVLRNLGVDLVDLKQRAKDARPNAA